MKSRALRARGETGILLSWGQRDKRRARDAGGVLRPGATYEEREVKRDSLLRLVGFEGIHVPMRRTGSTATGAALARLGGLAAQVRRSPGGKDALISHAQGGQHKAPPRTYLELRPGRAHGDHSDVAYPPGPFTARVAGASKEDRPVAPKELRRDRVHRRPILSRFQRPQPRDQPRAASPLSYRL
jgi:hypothetical protein